MSRLRTVEISALNIALHSPHSAQGYVDLFKRAYRRRKIFGQGELHALMLGSLSGTRDAVSNDELHGEVFRFVKVDASEPWFNTETKEQATEEELDDLKIPDNLHAHMQRIQFVFFPKKHQLWFASRDGKDRLGAQRAESFFQLLLNDASNVEDGQKVNVTAIPDKAALDEMFSIYKLSRIVMQFKRPNPDDAAGVHARIAKRMERENLSTINEELIANRGESIQLGEQTRAEAEVAAKNGRVEVYGKESNGTPVNESTINKPLRISVRVDRDVELTSAALVRAHLEH